MKGIAFSTLACPGWSLDQVIDAAGRYGYDGVELRLIDGELIDPAMPAPERRRVRKLFRSAGLPIVAADSSIRLAAAAEATTETELRAFLRLAADLEAPMVRVFGGQWPEGRNRDEALGRAVECLVRVAPGAERLGVGVALETHDAFSSAVTVAEVLARVSSPAVGALWDLHHPHRMGETPEQVLELLGHRVLHVHAKDARRRPTEGGDQRWELVLLGQGEVPVAACLRALSERGYAGWVAVEWEKKWHPEIAGPEAALPQHAMQLREWLGGGGGGGGWT